MNKLVPAVLALVALAGCARGQTRDQAATDTAAVADTGTVADSGGAVVSDSGTPRRTPPVGNAPKTIDAVLAAHTDSLMAIPGVLGTAVGRCAEAAGGALCIRVLVSRVTEEIRRRVPPELEGYPVRIDATGPIAPRP